MADEKMILLSDVSKVYKIGEFGLDYKCARGT